MRSNTRPVPALLIILLSTGVLFVVGTRSDTYAQLYAGLDSPSRVEEILPPGRDVVVTYVPTFMLLRLFDPGHHYIFTTHWSHDGARAGADLSGQRMMENMERGGFTSHEVLDLPAIVQEVEEFSLLAEPDRLPWLQDRFLRSGDFEVTQVGSLPEWYPMTVWRICCLHAVLDPAPSSRLKLFLAGSAAGETGRILQGMSMDPRDTVEKAGTNTNQGMHTRSYLAIVVVSVLVVLAVLLFAVFNPRSGGKPKPRTAPTTSGQNSPTPQ